MPLDIIGPGFGRTGTSSLKVALEHLGFGPVHHMFEVRDNPSQLANWQALARGEIPAWDDVFRGYRSQMDWPGARYWRQVAAHYPKAKVIMTVRDPNDWFDSVEATILQLMAARGHIDDPHMSGVANMAHEIVEVGEFDGRMNDRAHAISVFNARIAEVKATIPASRLLVLDVAEGWKPLCDFLECDVPAITFPKLNSSKQFVDSEWKDEIVAPVA